MGVFVSPKDRDTVLASHVASMRSYAETLAGFWPFVSRKSVIARVRKCAAEVERAYCLAKIYETRQGQSPNGGDVEQAPALLTGPAREAGDAQ